jgi:hypothetical protein
MRASFAGWRHSGRPLEPPRFTLCHELSQPPGAETGRDPSLFLAHRRGRGGERGGGGVLCIQRNLRDLLHRRPLTASPAPSCHVPPPSPLYFSLLSRTCPVSLMADSPPPLARARPDIHHRHLARLQRRQARGAAGCRVGPRVFSRCCCCCCVACVQGGTRGAAAGRSGTGRLKAGTSVGPGCTIA